MLLEEIKLTNFRNFDQLTVALEGGINCFSGNNGVGKTSILEAVYYLCLCKSISGATDRQLMKEGCDFFRLSGIWSKEQVRNEVVAKVLPGKPKVMEWNKVPYSKVSDHIGVLSVVFIGPDETQLATEGSDIRRKFMDNTLSQVDKQYLQSLVKYNKVIEQRNASLKQATQFKDLEKLLEVFDLQLIPLASYIHSQRTEFIREFLPFFVAIYSQISEQAEIPSLEYLSALDQSSLDVLLKKSRQKDAILQRTTEGVHKDDLEFGLNGRPLKKSASQGQLKSFVLALKLAQFQWLKEKKEKLPIILLDDIFDKLDGNRVNALLHFLTENAQSQVLVTDTDPERITTLLENLSLPLKKHYLVKNGTVEAF